MCLYEYVVVLQLITCINPIRFKQVKCQKYKSLKVELGVDTSFFKMFI